MNKFRLISVFVVLAMLFGFANVSSVAATSPNPLDDGGWELVAHMSNSGGMFDGNGELMPNYSYGTFVANPVASTPDFQRAFPVVADKILFITGDLSIWGIADYEDLRTLIDARGAVYPFPPNLAFEIGVGGVVSNTAGNVLSRPSVLEDPWITMDGGHYDGINNQRIVWGENNYGAGTHQALKNNHGGINVYVKAAGNQPTTVTFQEGVEITVNGVGTGVIYNGTHDTFIASGQYANYATGSTSGTMYLDDYPCCSDGLIRFENIFGPGVGQVPVGSTITTANLGVLIIDSGTGINYGEIHTDYPWDEATASWNSVLGGNGVTFGVDTTLLGLGIPENTGANVWNLTDVTASLSAWSADPALNNGWGWKPDGGNTGLMGFNSSEHPNSGTRPYLSVTFLPSDTTAPIAGIPTQSPDANGVGWNNTDVTVTWNWSDEAGGSGIDNAACTTSSTSTGEGELTLTATCKDLAGNEGSASYTVNIDQTLPVADAGSDQSIHAGYTVNLDGGASSDDNTLPEALSYNWSFFSTPAGNIATLNYADTVTPSFTPNVSGEYVAQLIVTDDADNDSEPVFVTLSSLNMAPTGDATATPMLPILGQAVSLDGTASSDPDGDAISYQWAITSKPVGSAASLTNATSAMASITPDVSGTYELTLTVSDFLEAGTPVTVSFVASTAEEFSQMQIINVSTVVVALEPAEITTAGNQEAFGNFLTNTMEQIQKGKLDKAIADLERAIARTDGCALRGSPDGNGAGMDWVTTCDAQASIYNSLVEALQVLQD